MAEDGTRLVPGTLPDLTIEMLARGFFREADRYGFNQADYLRFVNRLLDMSMGADGSVSASPGPGGAALASTGVEALPLSGPRVRIRAFDPASDMPVFRRWMADDMGRYFLLARTLSRRMTLEAMVDDPASLVGVVTLPDGTPIGSTAFLDVDRDQGKAELRKLIGEPSMRGQGFAKAASRLWIGYGLYGIGLRKIYLQTLNTNLRNIRLNEDLGFRVEGILHDEALLDGRCCDVLRMALWRGREPEEVSVRS